MHRSPRFRLSSLALALALVAGLAASPARADDAPREELAFAHSIAEVAATARGLALGDRLHLEGIPLADDADGEILGLALERFEVFSPDAVVIVHGDGGSEERLPAPDHAYFRGRVVGEPSSLALVTVLEDGRVHGFLRRRGATLALVPEAAEGTKALGGPRGLVAVAPTAEKDGGEVPRFECALDDLPVPDVVAQMEREAARIAASAAGEAEAGPNVIEKMVTQHTARVAVETDWELFQTLGGATPVAEYVGDLLAFASVLYDDEIDTNLVVSHLSTWSTSNDPWTQSSSLCSLFQFGRYWNDNRGNVDRTIAHYVSGKPTGGGVAWVGVLCSGGFLVDRGASCGGLSPQIDNYGGAYGFTGNISGTFDAGNPNQVWDIIAVSHEIGHNFNSPHTHCYNGLGGSSSPVDGCYNLQSGCWSGTASLPGPAGQSSGTIMSYCHLLNGSYTNIAFNFGTDHPYGTLPGRVPDRMRAHVDSMAGSNAICLARQSGGGGGVPGCTDGEITLSNDTVSSTETYLACEQITAGDTDVTSTGNLTLRAPTVVLGDGFRVLSGGELMVGNS